MTAIIDSLTYESDVRVIVRCAATDCRRAHRADLVIITVTTAYLGRPATRRTVAFNGRERTYRDRYDLHAIVTAGFICTGCGGRGATVSEVQGRLVESVKCGAKCRNAVGPSCDCSCGGENHAAGHGSILA